MNDKLATDKTVTETRDYHTIDLMESQHSQKIRLKKLFFRYLISLALSVVKTKLMEFVPANAILLYKCFVFKLVESLYCLIID